MAARRYERGDFLAGFISPVRKSAMTQTKMKVVKENAERIQASGEGLRKFTAINNNTTSTSTEASSYALPDHSKGTWPAR